MKESGNLRTDVITEFGLFCFLSWGGEVGKFFLSSWMEPRAVSLECRRLHPWRVDTWLPIGLFLSEKFVPHARVFNQKIRKLEDVFEDPGFFTKQKRLNMKTSRFLRNARVLLLEGWASDWRSVRFLYEIPKPQPGVSQQLTVKHVATNKS